jgi:hypothetical protein
LRFSPAYHIRRDILKMIQSGFDINEPYLQGLLQSLRSGTLRLVEQKARIIIRDGASLIGVLDEYGVLGEDEVFIQIDDGVKTCIEGKVTVTKCPCLHPGISQQYC